MKDGEIGKVYADGEVIFREGERGEMMYSIQSGQVKITKQAFSGPIAIATIGLGEIFGEMSLFDKLPRSATATAQGEARVLSIDRQKLFSSISHDPTLMFKILETMSGRIRRLNENLAELVETKKSMHAMSFNVEDTCHMILEEARSAVKADNGSVMLYEDAAQALSIKAAFGNTSGSLVTFAAGSGIAGDVFKTGKAELVNNVTIDTRFIPGELQVRSLLCVPLKCAEQSLGVMNMSMSTDRLFAIDDLKALHALAAYAAMAIQNAMNFSSLKHATDRILSHATMLDMS